jgi:hypothetical protein
MKMNPLSTVYNTRVYEKTRINLLLSFFLAATFCGGGIID